ncbi:MAG: phosphoesterase [Sphingobacteriales bacterium]|nr:MAG: phosphoesterase [Sphingobacteriales bacterium]
MYDLIGDIHGHAEPLKRLLRKMGYRESMGSWQHPERKAIFVGDYIDRGPAIRETLAIVRRMQESGNAVALLGNHEFNALAYGHQLPDGSYLRSHKEVHNQQHEQTLLQFSGYQKDWQSYTEWFYSLPLFLELPELRAVHACWDEGHIAWLRKCGYETLNKELLVQSHDKHSYAYRVIEDLLKGKEYNLPEGVMYKDKDGHPRTASRYKWWIRAEGASFGSYLFHCPADLHQHMIDGSTAAPYPTDAKPVFFGHYWLEDQFPVIQAANVVCLDYSIAKGGNLVAYRWNGESVLDNTHFVSVSSEC